MMDLGDIIINIIITGSVGLVILFYQRKLSKKIDEQRKVRRKLFTLDMMKNLQLLMISADSFDVGLKKFYTSVDSSSGKVKPPSKDSIENGMKDIENILNYSFDVIDAELIADVRKLKELIELYPSERIDKENDLKKFNRIKEDIENLFKVHFPWYKPLSIPENPTMIDTLLLALQLGSFEDKSSSKKNKKKRWKDVMVF